ncbi:OmpH family outer membrane protein [Cryomorpha ignava]|uniref:OmpH family outer membrane protein n=1 Tax=Cryomorpha ignava TaxID=101383 RepID=A0A7K3WQ65_9FLAO|nr:OmpH family outer membrane protein [Cryomorpha ignava]NEN23628.1 OmpH family outer membrane protein [Cryomorpha ignava]
MNIKSIAQLSLLTMLGISLFSCKQEQAPQTNPVSTNGDTLSTKRAVEGNDLKVAFIYGDTVNTRYQFLLDAEAELESERKRIDRRLRTKLEEAEKRAGELQRKAPTMTQNEMQQAQAELQNLDLEMQQYQEKLGLDFRKRETELQTEYISKVNAYLENHNADGQYDMILNFQNGGNLLWIKQKYNITDEVIDGLNEAYQNDLNAKKSDKAKP